MVTISTVMSTTTESAEKPRCHNSRQASQRRMQSEPGIDGERTPAPARTAPRAETPWAQRYRGRRRSRSSPAAAGSPGSRCWSCSCWIALSTRSGHARRHRRADHEPASPARAWVPGRAIRSDDLGAHGMASRPDAVSGMVALQLAFEHPGRLNARPPRPRECDGCAWRDRGSSSDSSPRSRPPRRRLCFRRVMNYLARHRNPWRHHGHERGEETMAFESARPALPL